MAIQTQYESAQAAKEAMARLAKDPEVTGVEVDKTDSGWVVTTKKNQTLEDLPKDAPQ